MDNHQMVVKSQLRYTIYSVFKESTFNHTQPKNLSSQIRNENVT